MKPEIPAWPPVSPAAVKLHPAPWVHIDRLGNVAGGTLAAMVVALVLVLLARAVG